MGATAFKKARFSASIYREIRWIGACAGGGSPERDPRRGTAARPIPRSLAWWAASKCIPTFGRPRQGSLSGEPPPLRLSQPVGVRFDYLPYWDWRSAEELFDV